MADNNTAKEPPKPDLNNQKPHASGASSSPTMSAESSDKKANKNPGNFANNPERAREAGRKGGKVSSGNFKNNPKRASEAGRKGGQK